MLLLSTFNSFTLQEGNKSICWIHFLAHNQLIKEVIKKQEYSEETEASMEHAELIVFHPLHKVQKVHVPQFQTDIIEGWDLIKSKEGLFVWTAQM